MYELYLARRLREEQRLAAQAENLLERAVHLQACRYYRDLLRVPPYGDAPAGETGDAPEWPL